MDAGNRIARWDGQSWTPLQSGLDEPVRGLAGFDDGSGPALYVGGFFDEAGGQPAHKIARWVGCPHVVAGDFDGDGDVDGFDFAAFLNCYSGPSGEISLACAAFDFDEDEDVDRHDFAPFQRAFTGP